MNSIEMTIGGQKYVLKGEEGEDHLREVAEMVKRKVEGLKKEKPALSPQKAAMLASFDLASEVIKGRKKAIEYRGSILSKAHELLSRVKAELGEAHA